MVAIVRGRAAREIFFACEIWEPQVMVVPTPHFLTISHSLLVESCNFPLSYICTTFYLETDPSALKMEAVRSSEMPVRFYQCIYIRYQKTVAFILRNLILLCELLLCEPYTIPKLIRVLNFILICIHSYRIRHAWIFR